MTVGAVLLIRRCVGDCWETLRFLSHNCPSCLFPVLYSSSCETDNAGKCKIKPSSNICQCCAWSWLRGKYTRFNNRNVWSGYLWPLSLFVSTQFLLTYGINRRTLVLTGVYQDFHYCGLVLSFYFGTWNIRRLKPYLQAVCKCWTHPLYFGPINHVLIFLCINLSTLCIH